MVSDRVPELADDTVYSEWKSRVNIWKKATKLDKKQMAPTLITRMRGKPESVAIQLEIDPLCEEDGVEKLIKEMDKLYEPDSTQQAFNSLDEFLNYKRPSDTTMEEYCREFSRKLKMLELKTGKKNMFEDGVLAYFLLQNSNLDQNSMMLIRATVVDLKLVQVEAALKKTFGRGSNYSDFKKETPGLSFIKQEGVYYGRNSRQSSSETDQSGYCSSASERGRYARPSTPSSDDENKTFFTDKGKYQPRKRTHHRNNGPRRRNLECFGCHKTGHKVADCPEKGDTTEKVSCVYCGKGGHDVLSCWKLEEEKAAKSGQRPQY